MSEKYPEPMKIINRPFFVLLILLLIFLNYRANATHIRAGEITAERVNCQSLTYKFTFRGYRDTSSPVEFGYGEIEFGDGSGRNRLNDIKESHTKQMLGTAVELNIITFTHTYPTIGEYLISYKELNRNPDINNIPGSVHVPFYIETQIVIDPFLGCNNTPVLLIPPIDTAAVGVRYLHNPGAYDMDGDSLSYTMQICKYDRDRDVVGYQFPNQGQWGAGPREDGSTPTIFNIDPVTGDLVWDAPVLQGEYNAAFTVEEWRKIEGEWFKLGYVTRDMQIIVLDTDNERPQLHVPEDTCVVAGTKLEGLITATDPDGDKVIIETYSGVYELRNSPGKYSPNPFEYQATPAQMTVEWQTNCSHVRNRTYTFHFKAKDNPSMGPGLLDMKTWNVRVIAPAPTGLVATAQGDGSVKLQWDSYDCGSAQTMQIWRRVGSYDFEPEGCETGMPDHAGYQLIAEVPLNVTEFIDTNNGNGLTAGAKYCYRIVAGFGQPSGGESYASEEACTDIAVTAPVITHVSVEKTDFQNGEILVKWEPPYDIDVTTFPPPHTYEVIRSKGFTGNSEQVVVATVTNTEFLDTGLNTLNEVYNYRIRITGTSGFNQSEVQSAKASSVKLDAVPLIGEIVLTWRATVPWSNQVKDHPEHFIYRDHVNENEEEFVLIDVVNVLDGRFRYSDRGTFNNTPLSEDITYRYYVTTQGAYGNELFDEPFLNKSQIVSARPNDTIPPCAPMALEIAPLENCEDYVKTLHCNFAGFENRLTWQTVIDPDCDEEVREYVIYYSPTGDENSMDSIAAVPGTEFIHSELSSKAGCYWVMAIDRSGNKSPLSEKVCVENCPHFELPNFFSPTGDEYNEVFMAYPEDPLKCPRFVESVRFRVYNRWGTEVYSFRSNGEEQSIYINWDGRANNGRELPAGTYYYVAEVLFYAVDPSLRSKTYKGWVKLMRQE